jgi:hypothetical protein
MGGLGGVAGAFGIEDGIVGVFEIGDGVAGAFEIGGIFLIGGMACPTAASPTSVAFAIADVSSGN